MHPCASRTSRYMRSFGNHTDSAFVEPRDGKDADGVWLAYVSGI